MTEAAAQRLYQVPPRTREGVLGALRLGLESMAAQPPMWLSDWSVQHFRLAGESSHQRGVWQPWPFQIGMLNAMCHDGIAELNVMKSKRVGYTKCLVASIAFDSAYRRRNQAVWQPTDDDRDSFVKSEIDPILDEVKAVRAARRKSKSEDTIKYKAFRDSVLHLLGGKAARAYRRITVAAAKLDEVDAFDQQIEKSSDPITLAEGRLEGAAWPKLIAGTTPRIKGLSHIEHRAQQAQVFLRYAIVCPHCKAEHPLIFGGKTVPHGMKWDDGEPETVRHVCPHCRGVIRQADYLANWHGRWVCDRTGVTWDGYDDWRDAAGQPIPAPRHVAIHVWAAYSPQREWVDIARQCIAARKKQLAGDEGPMQGFKNETLGETWEIIGERTEEHELQRRAEPYQLRTVPVGALELTAGIDVQGSRWEIGVWGWGAGMESWVIDHHIIEGNPEDVRDWEHVARYLDRRYTQAWHGGSLGISATSIDSGHHTQAVYSFVRAQQARRRIYAIKGASEEAKPIRGTATPVEVNWRGQRFPHGLKLWLIGTDTAKDLLHGQLQITDPGPGYVHFSSELLREWYEQLTAEQRILVRVAGGEAHRWVKRRPRNEVLDCRNYALHAAYMLRMDARSDAEWQRLASAVQPPADLFTQPPQPPAAAAPIEPVHTDARPPAAAPAPLPARQPALAGREW